MFSSFCSYFAFRKNSREDLLFGEAGSELLNILLQPLPQLLVEECSPKLARVKTPPLLRASNPITMNSEFEEQINAKPDPLAIRQPVQTIQTKGNEATKSKELRTRSASWPGLPKASTKKTEKS